MLCTSVPVLCHKHALLPSPTPCSFRTVPLVCKRFHRLLLSPILLQDLRFELSSRLSGEGPAMQRQAAKLAAWLDRHASGVVTCLRLAFGFPLNLSGFGEDYGAVSDALETLLEMVPVLNANRQMVDLTVAFGQPVRGVRTHMLLAGRPLSSSVPGRGRSWLPAKAATLGRGPCGANSGSGCMRQQPVHCTSAAAASIQPADHQEPARRPPT